MNAESSPLPPPVPQPEAWEKHGVKIALGCQVLLLAVAGWQNRFQLNTDGIAYLRIAHYYATGQSDLMVSGYWGPLLSWLLVPFLKLGFEPLSAARVVMALSALVFTTSCARLFKRMDLALGRQAVGVWIAVALSTFWSVRYLTPDVLLAGLMAVACSNLMDKRWVEDCELALQTGLIWAVAYLAKAVAFPLGFLITAGIALFWKRSGTAPGKVFTSVAWTLIPFMLASLPWIVTLSIKYKTVTFSTSGPINHALAGPPDAERYHPFARTYHQPEAGRVTSWEDPSRMKYNFWSPTASKANALHQAKVIAGNVPAVFHWVGGINPFGVRLMNREFNPQEIFRLMPGFDLFYLGVCALVGCLIGSRRDSLVQEKWRWAIVPAVCIMGIYLPVFLLQDDQRYMYPLFPFLWVAVSGAFNWVMRHSAHRGTKAERTSWRIVVASFGLPALFWMLVGLVGIPNPASDCARELALRMKLADLRGAIVGSGQLPGGRTGLFTAFFLGEPWYGDSSSPTPSGYLFSKARFVMVHRIPAITGPLDRDPAFHDLDPKLFKSPEEAENFPIKVYELKNDHPSHDSRI